MFENGPRRDAVAAGSSVGSNKAAEPTSPPAIAQAARLRIAVRNAVEAYARTGQMVDAALEYAKLDLPVFPLDPRSKRPIPKRDPDPSGQYLDGIPGTGGVYKATTDPLQIRAWWRDNPKALIGLPMGPRTGVWGLDVDTPEDHDDGVSEWNKLAGAHEPPIVTREHRSATDGPHFIFTWDPNLPIGCSKGALPDGISVKGQGGYIVVPPSVRKGRSYTVFRDIDPALAPSWLTDLILQGRPARQWDSTAFEPDEDVDLDELADAMRFVPNDDLDWDEWTAHGLALFAATGGSDEGFALFDQLSQLSSKYNERYTRQRWQEFKGSPPDRTGAGKIFKIAWEHGWRGRRGKLATATYPEPSYASAAAARERMREIVRWFLLEDVAKQNDPWWRHITKRLGEPPVVKAARIEVAVGKTEITIEELSAWIHRKAAQRPFIYAADRHKLNEKIEQRFAAQGIDARIFRGRMAEDPENFGELMCRNVPAVELAMSYGAAITETCCKQGKRECALIRSCGYWRQIPEKGDEPQVWIVAHDMLFFAQEALGKPLAVIIDEGMWDKGIRALDDNDKWNVALDSISTRKKPPDDLATLKKLGLDAFELEQLRCNLARALRQQRANGGVEREQLEDYLRAEHCARAIKLEWKLMPPLGQFPDMTQAQLKKLAFDHHDLIDAIIHSRRMIKIWETVRGVLENPDIAVSGRLTLQQKNGQRVMYWCGVDSIKTQFQAPTLMLDATLPDKKLLQIYHPSVEVVADIRVAMPASVHIRQVLGAPTSANKLENEIHLESVRRYILQRFIECGRQPTLVICQARFERWLRQRLPLAIALAHYNDITGLDDFKHVRLLILVGRTQPGPAGVEVLAGALTGRAPRTVAARRGGFAWYPSVTRGIRLADGSAHAVKGDRHPDLFCEGVRQQICESELVQAIGRGRGINRTPATPLDIDLLFDTCLPITVNQVTQWQTPSLLLATAADEGVMLTAPVDMVKLWGALWPNEKAAYRRVRQGIPRLARFEAAEYQLAGAKMKRRLGYFDPAVIPDARAWLGVRLGPLAPP